MRKIIIKSINKIVIKYINKINKIDFCVVLYIVLYLLLWRKSL